MPVFIYTDLISSCLIQDSLIQNQLWSTLMHTALIMKRLHLFFTRVV